MSFKKYSNYVQSEIEWLKEYPRDWELLKLKYLCDINTGSRDTQDKTDEGEYPFFVRSPIIEKLDEFTHDEEAVMTAGDGVGVGKVFHYYYGKFSAHQRVYVFTKFKNVIGKFLYYYLKANLAFEVLSGNAKSTVDSLRRPMLAEFLVVIPSLQEQDSIVDFLDENLLKINKLINSKLRLIKLLEEKRQSVITETVTKGLNPNVKMKDSGVEWIGEIPEGWDKVHIRRIIKQIKDGTHGSFERTLIGKPLLSAKNVTNRELVINDSESLISEIDYESIVRNGFPKKNDLLITIVGTIGRTYLYDLEYPLAFQRSVAFLRFNHNVIPKFYFYFVQSKPYFEELMSYAKTSAQSGVYMGDILKTVVLIPAKREQQEIVEYLDMEVEIIEQNISLINMQIDLLKDYRQSLIYEAVTGKIDLRDIEIDS